MNVLRVGLVIGLLLLAQFPDGDARGAEDFIEGTYWALIIGIDKYPTLGDDMQLTSSRIDAQAVASVLRQRYGFPKDQVIELYDEAATRKAILKVLRQLKQQLGPKDSLLVYYAGQGGYEGKKGKGDEIGYWLPYDAIVDDPSSTVFNTEVRDAFYGYPARHVLLVSDSVFGNVLMGKTLTSAKAATRELYRDKSRWVLASGGNKPTVDADKNKNGHSIFGWHFLKVLETNTEPYKLGAFLAEAVAASVTKEKQGKLPRSAPIIGAGDEGGQFVLRLLPEFQKGGTMAVDKAKAEREKARLDAEKAKVDAAQKELEDLERQLKEAEESLKKGKKP